MADNNSKFQENHEAKEINAYNQLMVANTMLDCKMIAIQEDLHCKDLEVDCSGRELEIDKEIVQRLQKDIVSLTERNNKSILVIDGLRTSKMMMHGMEISLNHQLQRTRERNKEIQKGNQEILKKYLSILNRYQEIYNQLPKVKKRNELEMEMKRLLIDVDMTKNSIEELHINHLIFHQICEHRTQTAIINLAKEIVERIRSYEELKKQEEKNIKLEECVRKLHIEKAQIMQMISQKAKEAITNVHERSARYVAGLSNISFQTSFKGLQLSRTQLKLSFYSGISSQVDRKIGKKYLHPDRLTLSCPSRMPDNHRKMFRMSEPPSLLQRLLERPSTSPKIQSSENVKALEIPSLPNDAEEAVLIPKENESLDLVEYIKSTFAEEEGRKDEALTENREISNEKEEFETTQGEEVKEKSDVDYENEVCEETSVEPKKEGNVEENVKLCNDTMEKINIAEVIDKVTEELGGTVRSNIQPGLPTLNIKIRKRPAKDIFSQNKENLQPAVSPPKKLETVEESECSNTEFNPHSPKTLAPEPEKRPNSSMSPESTDDAIKEAYTNKKVDTSPQQIFRTPSKLKNNQENIGDILGFSPEFKSKSSIEVKKEKLRKEKNEILSEIINSPIYNFGTSKSGEKGQALSPPFTSPPAFKGNKISSRDFGGFFGSSKEEQEKKKTSSTNSFFQLF